MDVLDLIERGGIIGILVFIVLSGSRGLWVFGWLYKAKVTECDGWKRLALRGTHMLEEAAKEDTP